ncbi:hypothetical protein XH83_33800 [Bradyrhizobium sp. CCBAU 53351]|uniref:hypothetical protein n=1 Tax=Bradyrhizobium sp. CCBAU 53351 TaxID=1325114 RepID=UPI0018876DC1|nr:hypothetical protein [Bradyrhizobium sp. CCBAU 53351]QOZ79921.1 hypothetical protein XH83_33800 [Bradyrhizobium sp. CCBAU 53351]
MTDLAKLLAKLDDANDDLWTQDGEPTLSAASNLAGKRLSRDEVRATGRMRGQARGAEREAAVNHALELAQAELATAAKVAEVAVIERRLKAARVALGESYPKYIRHQAKPSVEDSIRLHLKRTAEHEAAGNVAAPVVTQHQSMLDSLMANGGRRGSAKPRGLLR